METTGQVSHTGTSDYPHYRGHSQGNGLVHEEHALCDVLRQTRQQRRLARACNAGDGTEHADRDVDVDAAQVVASGVAGFDSSGGSAYFLFELRADSEVAADPFMCFCRLSLSLERTEDCKRTMRPW